MGCAAGALADGLRIVGLVLVVRSWLGLLEGWLDWCQRESLRRTSRCCSEVFGWMDDADELESLILAQSERWRHA